MTKTPGIVVRRHRLTETSLIVTWCTQERGLVKTVAKGALRPKSALAGRVDLFLAAEVAFVESRRSDLHTLREAEVTNHRLGVRESWRRVMAASYFVHLIEQLAEPATPIPELYDLLERALDFLDRQDPDRRAVLHFEKELARSLGMHAPDGKTPWQALQHHGRLRPNQREPLLAALENDHRGATPSEPAG